MGGDALIVIGLTGRYCAGKNHIASLFERRGFALIDVDKLGHQTLQEARESLAVTFGREILIEDGAIDRKKLGAIVFSDAHRLHQLEQIVHPLMVRQCLRMVEHQRALGAYAVVLNAALLHRMKLDAWCDAVCFVSAPKWLRLLRAIRRDKATVSSFLRVERSQRDIRVGMIDGARTVHIVENWGPVPFIHRQVQEFCATMGI